jgi:hypothetical protein
VRYELFLTKSIFDSELHVNSFICLLIDAVSISDCTESNGTTTGEELIEKVRITGFLHFVHHPVF